MGVDGKRHAPAALPRERLCTNYIGGWVGARGRSGRVRKVWRPTGIRSPDRPARRESLYRLRYHGPPRHGYTSFLQNDQTGCGAFPLKILLSKAPGV